MRWVITAVSVLSVLSGCQTGSDILTSNSRPATVTGPTASAIAGDMAGRFAEQVGPPGTMTFKMVKDSSEYATALEAAIKGWGYTIVTDGRVGKKETPVDISWSVDSLDGQILARLSTPLIAISRAYTTTKTGAMPASPLSILQKN
ncbi:conjugal transfer protein TrbH [Agrobacterium rhizogenes]|uniref:conjugal transfer protein TrbH n=1 Tax=Rhizobium rhizogenes TaxID=359 RepID=UPI0022B64B5F|nr:conjugal transfer protein TrbH [Rhizobium rhizogenes]MCZ7450244.1 conjugal transfer protein TrbH [Rhizobium rhizogenes]